MARTLYTCYPYEGLLKSTPEQALLLEYTKLVIKNYFREKEILNSEKSDSEFWNPEKFINRVSHVRFLDF